MSKQDKKGGAVGDSVYRMSGESSTSGGGEKYTEASKKKSTEGGGMSAPMANC